MPLRIDVRQLEGKTLQVTGELAAEELAAGFDDPLITFASPLAYDLELEEQAQGILMQGELRVTLECTCRRCLKTFTEEVDLPDFAALAAYEGEDAMVREGDFADLTPYLREDIYLGLPTNPLCKPECRGLARKAKARDSRLQGPPSDGSSPWGALDRLKL